MKHGRICSVCNTEYAYCPNCNSYDSKPRWMFLFCSENCKDIFETVSAYNQGRIDTKTARKRLEECDLQKAEPLKSGTKEGIEKINGTIQRKKTVFIDQEPLTTQESVVIQEEFVPQPEQKQKFKKRKHQRFFRDSDMTTEALS